MDAELLTPRQHPRWVHEVLRVQRLLDGAHHRERNGRLGARELVGLERARAPHPIRNPAEDEAAHLQRWRDFMRLGSEPSTWFADCCPM